MADSRFNKVLQDFYKSKAQVEPEPVAVTSDEEDEPKVFSLVYELVRRGVVCTVNDGPNGTSIVYVLKTPKNEQAVNSAPLKNVTNFVKFAWISREEAQRWDALDLAKIAEARKAKAAKIAVDKNNANPASQSISAASEHRMSMLMKKS